MRDLQKDLERVRKLNEMLDGIDVFTEPATVVEWIERAIKAEALNRKLLENLLDAILLLRLESDCSCDYHKGRCAKHREIEVLTAKYHKAKEGLE